MNIQEMTDLELIETFVKRIELSTLAGRQRGDLSTYARLLREKNLLQAEIFRRLRREELP